MLHQNLGMAVSTCSQLVNPRKIQRNHLKTGVAVRWHHSLWHPCFLTFLRTPKRTHRFLFSFPFQSQLWYLWKKQLGLPIIGKLERWNPEGPVETLHVKFIFTIRQWPNWLQPPNRLAGTQPNTFETCVLSFDAEPENILCLYRLGDRATESNRSRSSLRSSEVVDTRSSLTFYHAVRKDRMLCTHRILGISWKLPFHFPNQFDTVFLKHAGNPLGN